MIDLRSIGTSSLATVTDLRQKTAALIEAAGSEPVAIQKNNAVVAVLVEPEAYARTLADAKKAAPHRH